MSYQVKEQGETFPEHVNITSKGVNLYTNEYMTDMENRLAVVHSCKGLSCCIFVADKAFGQKKTTTSNVGELSRTKLLSRVFKEVKGLRASRHHTSVNYKRKRKSNVFEDLLRSQEIAHKVPQANHQSMVKPWYKPQNTSVYKGVSWHKRDKRYAARIRYGGKSKHIGNYKEELRAAIEVDRAVLLTKKPETKKLNFSNNIERGIAEVILNEIRSSEKSKKISMLYKSSKSKDLNGYPNRLPELINYVG